MFAFRLYESSRSKKSLYFDTISTLIKHLEDLDDPHRSVNVNIQFNDQDILDLWLNLSHWLDILNTIVRANQYGDSLV